MKMYAALIRLLFFSSFAAEATIYTGRFSRVQTGQRMSTNAVTQAYNGISISRCAANSLKLPTGTVAFNYASQTGSCELIQDLPTDLVSDDNYNYYVTSSVSPCDVSPCKHGGLCQVSASGIDYNCTDCPYPTTGKNCQELSCDVDCIEIGDEDNASAVKVVFFYNRLQTFSWLGAYNHCRSLHMDLVTIKSNTTYYYVVEKLVQMYVNEADAPHSYWIGLNRSSELSPWTWVDQEPLGGEWNAWFYNAPRTDLCVCLPNPHYNFTWVDRPCDGYGPATNYMFYPICQLPIHK